ncbi:hypothetical protein MRX96_010558 [Rhipicephalus microplus]
MRRKRKHFTGKDGATQVNDRNIGRGTHLDQKPSPSFKHKTKTALRLLPPHLCRDPDRGLDRGLDPKPAIPGLPDKGGRRIPKLKRTERRPWHRGTLPGELG